jgi:hypothetical protein
MPEVAADTPPFAVRPAMLALALLVGALVAGTLGLWAHYGTAVFYEIVAAGIAACF